MSYSYSDKLRRTLLDIHIEEWNPEFLSKFSPEEYFKNLKIANVNAPMIYLQSHVGLCYWSTKSGKMHDAFVGKEDAMKRLFDMCHDDGMAVVLYYSLIFNNWAYDKHPEWRMLDVDGKGSRAYGKRYGLCCPNNMEYRDFVREQIAEFCDYLDFEGIFLDMTYWPITCYCDKCRSRWENEVGGEMPTIIDWNEERWNIFYMKRMEWMEDFAFDMTAEIKRYKPNCAVEHQNSNAVHAWRFGTNELISKASDFAGGDLYGGIAQESFACKLYYNLTQNQPFEYMTSRCYPSLSEHTTTKSLDQLRASVMTVALHHGACLVIDAIDPIGTLDKAVYERVGTVFKEMEAYEKYLTRGKQIYDVAVYFNLNGKMDVEKNNLCINSPEAHSHSVPHFESTFGAAESLRKNHIAYTVFNNWKLDLFDTTKVLIISDAPKMAKREVDAVRTYVKNGGKLYISGHSALELVEEFFGGKIESRTVESITYMSPMPNSNYMEGLFTAEHPLVMFEPSFKLVGHTSGEVLAKVTLPYTVPNPVALADGLGLNMYIGDVCIDDIDPRYKFSTIHSNPPGIKTELPALIKTTIGKGTVIWSAVPFEKADRYQHSTIFSRIISDLVGDKPVFTTNAPDVVEIIIFDAIEHNQKYVGMINLQEGFNILPVYDIEICVNSERKPLKVLNSANDKSVDFIYVDGMIKLNIHKLQCFDMYTICY